MEKPCDALGSGCLQDSSTFSLDSFLSSQVILIDCNYDPCCNYGFDFCPALDLVSVSDSAHVWRKFFFGLF